MTRETRAEAVQTERRRRRDDTIDRVHQTKLGLPAEFRDDTANHYRWINDDDTRLYDMTVEDDWSHVTTKGTESSDEDKVRRPVGKKDNGEPLYAYLCSKPVEFVKEDARRAEMKLRETEDQLMTASKTSPEDNRSEAVSYVPSGNSIKRGPYTA